MQEGHPDFLFVSLEAGNPSHTKGALPASGGRRAPLSPKIEGQAKKPVYTNHVTPLLPQVQTGSLDSSLIDHPKPTFFVLFVPCTVLFLCVKSIKAACFGHFSGPISMGPPCA